MSGQNLPLTRIAIQGSKQLLQLVLAKFLPLEDDFVEFDKYC